ncbi:MAG: peptide chain release factor N(5)-glutamine methyltransferase [Deltaproteobacteria bacterium]|nr:peptide chain release factor N(5)-glutamine methyltransferase [Deltaproteobacteria bacterium]
MKTPQTISDRSWTILNLLKWTTTYFKTHAIDNPRSTAEVLLSHALGLQRIDLYLQFDRPMHADELKIFKALIKRRLAREPVAYITGTREFWSLDFQVTRDVLIPRPETECLVETSLEIMSDQADACALNILELGTGSGAVTVALASQQSRHHYFASDISVKALAVARMNGIAHEQTAIHFFAADWLSSVKKAGARFNLILSNPPYIPRPEISGLQPEIHRYEPHQALDGKTDGLGCLQEIIDTAPDCLVPGGFLLLEIGYGQKDQIAKIVGHKGCYDQITFIKDYSGIHRIVRLRKAVG